MRIWLAEASGVEGWRSGITRREHLDYRTVTHLDYRDACARFDVPTMALKVSPWTDAGEVIHQFCGERPRTHTLDELQRAAWDRVSADDPLLQVPNLRLEIVGRSGRFSHGTLEQAGVRDGDMLLVRRVTPDDLAAVLRRRGVLFSMELVEDADQFMTYARGQMPARRHRYARRIGLLYTDEDVAVASYVRAHFDALNRMSGERCDIFFIENPGAVNPFQFWRPLLTEKLYVAWKLLGWTESVPYDKAEAYEIARELGIDAAALPCACVFHDATLPEVIPLTSNLTADFRRLVDRAGGGAAPIKSEERRPVCFLSHASADKHIVRQVAVTLHSLGIDAWFDEWQLRAGDPVVGKIQEGLESAKWIVLFLSRRSLDSPWLNAELEAALHAQIASRKYEAIIPVMLDQCELSPLLRNYKRIEAGTDVLRIAEEIQRALQL